MTIKQSSFVTKILTFIEHLSGHTRHLSVRQYLCCCCSSVLIRLITMNPEPDEKETSSTKMNTLATEGKETNPMEDCKSLVQLTLWKLLTLRTTTA